MSLPCPVPANCWKVLLALVHFAYSHSRSLCSCRPVHCFSPIGGGEFMMQYKQCFDYDGKNGMRTIVLLEQHYLLRGAISTHGISLGMRLVLCTTNAALCFLSIVEFPFNAQRFRSSSHKADRRMTKTPTSMPTPPASSLLLLIPSITSRASDPGEASKPRAGIRPPAFW